MQAGKLRELVSVQTFTRTPDGQGGFVSKAWTDFLVTHAAITPATSREAWAARQLEHNITHSVSMRYFAGILTEMRIKYGTRVFNIKSIIDIDERHREYKIMCEESITTKDA